ncbi:WAT1-related protein At5g47470-like isoform X2 [Prosopis cineraria]|uniref:WAT1-related protein At5g47470-like isoform X2 n=1 Tax=Prosopis cineraria TaxID=364024 RepID=UPI00240F7DC9|nr:WAT1-related protein At5g47470-like isoform X2 [Prosopis cineraria]
MEMWSGGMSCNAIEDIVIMGGLIGVQFVYAGSAVLMSFLMALGLSSLSIVIYTSFATFLVLLPFSIYFERSKWPRKLSLKFVIQLLMLSFGGVTLFQSLFLKGINLTSPAMGTAMPNLAPGLIFIIAWTFGLEKVELSCRYSRVKIIGTMVCMIGAFTMSIMQSATPPPSTSASELQPSHTPSLPDHSSHSSLFDSDKIIGSLYLMAAVFMLSSNVVLQAFTLGDFPAPMTLSAMTSLLGAITTIIAQLLEEHSFDTASLVNFGSLASYSFLAGGLGGICLSFNGWALKKRGPVLVSMFSPVATVTSLLSSFTLGYSTNLGSIVGMLLMFTGLYFVLWAKGKEDYDNIRYGSEKA